MTTFSMGLALLLIISLLLLLIPLAKKSGGNKDKITPKSLIAIGLFIPIFSITTYFALGTPQFAEVATNQAPAPMQTLVDKLETKLKQKPNDFDGWLLLGRSYSVTEEHNKAIHAFEKALSLQPNNLNALLPLANAIATHQSNSLVGRPYQLLLKAYSIAPANQMTLWLLGMAEKQKGNPGLAKTYWQALYQQLPNDSKDKNEVQIMLASLEGQTDKLINKQQAEEETKLTSQINQNIHPHHQNTEDGIKITFELDKQTKQKIANATVFIYAKQPQGMPMPIAAKRLKGKNLPNTVVLSQADELIPNRTLKQFNSLILGVKISQGDANSKNILYQKELKTQNNGELNLIIRF